MQRLIYVYIVEHIQVLMKEVDEQNDLPFGSVLEIIPKCLNLSPGTCCILKTNIHESIVPLTYSKFFYTASTRFKMKNPKIIHRLPPFFVSSKSA